MSFDPSLREEAKSFTGIGALLDSKDLYFQTFTPMYPGKNEARTGLSR
jgi:hypothetical protein